MAVRAINSCVILRPPVARFPFRSNTKLGFLKPPNYVTSLSYSIQTLFYTLIDDLLTFPSPSRTRPSNKLEVTGKTGLLEDRVGKPALQKGFLLEFKKDSEKVLLAVVQKPDGKKNWIVSDQNGTTMSIKPQQITYIVQGAENFDYADIAEFVHKAQNNLDPTLLEFAWLELLEKNESVTVKELAEMVFGSSEPLECYCAHLLLSKDDVYFTVLETRYHSPVYGPRSAAQITVSDRTLSQITVKLERKEDIILVGQ
ncbi:exoribonuclease [Lithospermum erythrorhizon]|uniref:Exoribonuclease n=1 Tax=Lithospermum erythrorhizon TaxID=34254 RepID=A0AAV3PEZ2_LITER